MRISKKKQKEKRTFWASEETPVDTYVLFRGRFHLDQKAHVLINHYGSAYYYVKVNGLFVAAGPNRYELDFPEYQCTQVYLDSGNHMITIESHYEGVETRILKKTSPFLYFKIIHDDGEITPVWKYCLLHSNKPCLRRTNPQLGWAEFRDLRLEPANWESGEFDDSAWQTVKHINSKLPDPVPSRIGCVNSILLPFVPISSGSLADRFGYDDDDPSYQFFIRDRECKSLPANGRWYLYDLGRVRLGRPIINLNAPAGTIIEIGNSEFLTDGKVSPWINFSLGASCNLDRFITSHQNQSICPFTPKGARYVEIHITNFAEEAEVLNFTFEERCFHQPTEGYFKCGNPLLEKIWYTGIETYRACAEDALIDNPTRERGQWTGDVVSIGLAIASVGYHDLRLARQALVQSSQSARDDGMVAGMCPGGCVFLPTYALRWFSAVMDYYRLTGDLTILDDLWDAAERNLYALIPMLKDGDSNSVEGWNFVDWGYLPNDNGLDPMLILDFINALRSMITWGITINKINSEFVSYEKLSTAAFNTYSNAQLSGGGLHGIGYHVLAYGAYLGFFKDQLNEVNDFLKNYWFSCFPSNQNASRIRNPFQSNERLTTPYFAHYMFQVLIENGDFNFVIEQYIAAWGWMLKEGLSTWLEVFDNRWSHCHQWSGCPTWQLSRYLSGLHPRFDLGINVFDFNLHHGNLHHASIKLPIAYEKWVFIDWEKDGEKITYKLSPECPIVVNGLINTAITIKSTETFQLEYVNHK